MSKFHLNDAGKKLGLLGIAFGCIAPRGAILGTDPAGAPGTDTGIPMKRPGTLPSSVFGTGADPGDGTDPISPPTIGTDCETIGFG